jgi:type I restriction enzyme S subunit
MILPELLAHILWSEIGQRQISLCQYGVKQGVGFNEVANLQIPVPPPELQQELVKRIEAQTATLDKLTKTIQRSVDKLYEARSALITAAVTGQIDISTWQNRGSTDRYGHAIEAETTK